MLLNCRMRSRKRIKCARERERERSDIEEIMLGIKCTKEKVPHVTVISLFVHDLF